MQIKSYFSAYSLMLMALLSTFSPLCYASDRSFALVISGPANQAGVSDVKSLKQNIVNQTSLIAINSFKKMGYDRVVHLITPTLADIQRVLAEEKLNTEPAKVAVYFIGEGRRIEDDSEILLTNKFKIYSNEKGFISILSSVSFWAKGQDLNKIFDKYIHPESQMLVVIHACQAGAIVNTIKAPHREVIVASQNSNIGDGYVDFDFTRFEPEEGSRLAYLDPHLFKGTALFSAVFFKGLTCQISESCFIEFDTNNDKEISLDEIISFSRENVRGYFWSKTVNINILGRVSEVPGSQWRPANQMLTIEPVYAPAE